MPRSVSLVIAYSPSIFWGPFLLFLRYRYGCKAYLVVRDLFPRWAVEVGLLSTLNPVYWYLRAMEHLLYRSADRIGVQASSDATHVRRSRPRGRVEVLNNWYSPGISGRSGQFRQRHQLGQAVVFVYGGNLGPAQNVSQLLALARAMRTFPDAYLVVIANGRDVDEFCRQLTDEDRSRVLTIAPMSHQEFEDVISEFDVGVVLLNPKLSTSNIPGKLLSYCAASLAILADVNSSNDLIAMLDAERAGAVSTGNTPDFIANARLLASDEAVRNGMKTGAERLGVKVFSTAAAADIICRSLSPK